MYEYYPYFSRPRTAVGSGSGSGSGSEVGAGAGAGPGTRAGRMMSSSNNRSNGGTAPPTPLTPTTPAPVPLFGLTGLVTWPDLGSWRDLEGSEVGGVGTVGTVGTEPAVLEGANSTSSTARGGPGRVQGQVPSGAPTSFGGGITGITAAELSAALERSRNHHHFAFDHGAASYPPHRPAHADPDGLHIMEQIDSQVTDLRYLVQAPVPLSDTPSAYETPQPHASPGSASLGDNSAPPTVGGITNHHHHHGGSGSNSNAAAHGIPGNGDNSHSNKRKSSEDGGAAAKQTRSKRNRYISIACNECKRRKIKCNGETPCQRCGNLNLACLYAPNCCSSNFKDTDDFRQVTDQLNRLQEQVVWLNQTVKALQNDAPPLQPAHERLLPGHSSASTPSHGTPSGPRAEPPSTRSGAFRGPTSMAYSLDVANATISNMGYRGLSESDEQQSQQTSIDAVPAPVDRPGTTDPLFEFDKDEMVRLCRLHEEEVGIMYPVLDIQAVIAHARSLSSVLDTLREQRPLEALNDEKTLQLKIIMCCALVVEEHAHSEKALRLYKSMESVMNRKLMTETSNVASLPLLALLAGYHFLAGDEILAWRHIGQMARLCLELGIHQKMGLLSIQNEEERKNALVSFWTAYVLDRRWAFGTGLPYVVQDDDIDPQLPLPDESPFLVAMITYSKLCAKVWRQVTHFGPILARELRQEEIERLDQDILQWYESIPEEVKVRSWSKDRHMVSTPSYNLQRLRIWTYLRLNQIRIWLYTPVLHSATSIMANPVQAQRAVDLAKDTIQYLDYLNTTTNMYRRIQVFYHQFLTSAIAVVFLASVHAPVRFSAVCREEFYLALELVKDLSAKSWVSKRLWKTIRSLKDVAPRFGLNPDDDPHSTAALGMIGLARGHVDPGSGDTPQSFSRPSVPNAQMVPGSQVDMNGVMIQTEMSRIFEGYVGLNGMQQMAGEDERQSNGAELPSPRSAGGLGASDGTVFPQLREMF